jgi:tetratricopeptide (TPR) repeat protein
LLYLANLFLGDLHKTEGRLAEAVASYREAVRAAPQWQVAYLSLSQALRASGNRSEARDVARKALELPVSDPEYVDGYRIYHLGQLNRVPELLERMRREVVQ